MVEWSLASVAVVKANFYLPSSKIYMNHGNITLESHVAMETCFLICASTYYLCLMLPLPPVVALSTPMALA